MDPGVDALSALTQGATTQSTVCDPLIQAKSTLSTPESDWRPVSWPTADSWDETGLTMIALIQRVSEARVTVDGTITGAIKRGLLVLLAVQPEDDGATAARLAERVLTYRVFPDENERMNRSLLDAGLELLAVPQFTLAADTRKGTRASFTRAAPPEPGRRYFDCFVAECAKKLPSVETGLFGANMQVQLVNDGPVTFWLEA
jgi:D-tyrosyl-tRNA(Tyr) deacylase